MHISLHYIMVSSVDSTLLTIIERRLEWIRDNEKRVMWHIMWSSVGYMIMNNVDYKLISSFTILRVVRMRWYDEEQCTLYDRDH